jgi:HAD superfamily hydrolase (TIGR01509 family)
MEETIVSTLHGVILDVDGTLVDSNDAHARAWVAALAEYGYDIPFERVRPLIGMGGDKLMPQVGGPSEDSDEGQRIGKRRAEIFKERELPALRPFPQTRELLQHMRERGLKLVVASSAKQAELDSLLKVAGANDLVEERTSSSDAENSKPDPDIVQVALDSAGLKPEQAVMLGDTPFDIEAARKAGVGTIALRCGGWHDHTLEGAIAVYCDPADLLEHYDSSPLG